MDKLWKIEGGEIMHRMERLSKWMVGGRARFLLVGETDYGWIEGGWKDSCGTGLELEASIWACVYLNMHAGGWRWMCLWGDIYTEFSAHTCISWLCQLSGYRDISAPGARSIPNTQCLSWFLMFLSNKRNQGSLAIWLIQGLAQGLYQLELGASFSARKWESVQQTK